MTVARERKTKITATEEVTEYSADSVVSSSALGGSPRGFCTNCGKPNIASKTGA